MDYRTEKPSWTWRGQAVPGVAFRYASGESRSGMLVAMVLGTPMRLREQYATAAAADPGAPSARIALRPPAHLLAFAGDQDAMWPGDEAARALAAALPGHGEAHVYPGAGHLFGSNDGYASGLSLGGTAEANARARAASDAVLDARLAAWHPAT